MKHFVMLLLADLASKSPIHSFDDKNIKTICLSAYYKEIIEDIMYQENSWEIKFAELINISSYYEYQINWEEKLTRMIKKVCSELNKEPYLDFENETIRIDFTKEEIDNIKNMYDEHTLETMDHFSNLMYAPDFRRNFKIESKEFNRNNARWQSHMEDLKLRTMYSNELKLAKPLTKLDKKEVKSLIKQLFDK